MCFVNSTAGEIKLLFHITLNRPPHFERSFSRETQQQIPNRVDSSQLMLAASDDPNRGTISSVRRKSGDTSDDLEGMDEEEDNETRVNVPLYRGFMLDCVVGGEPEPNVTWFKVG